MTVSNAAAALSALLFVCTKTSVQALLAEVPEPDAAEASASDGDGVGGGGGGGGDGGGGIGGDDKVLRDATALLAKQRRVADSSAGGAQTPNGQSGSTTKKRTSTAKKSAPKSAPSASASADREPDFV